MNKILTLYNIEFKRIYKLYFALIGVLFSLNIGNIILTLYRVVNRVAGELKSKPKINMLKLKEAKEILLGYEISNMYRSTTILLGFTVILCLIYAVLIWYRDIYGKSKTGYTLFMLPGNKFSVYISKLITIVVMIYGATVAQIFSWIVDMSIVSVLSNISIKKMVSLFLTYSFRHGDLTLIQTQLIDFLMINVLGVILAVLVIFTGVMIQRASRKLGIIVGVIYIVACIVGYILIFQEVYYTDQLLIAHSIFYIVVFTISVITSYSLINKKIYM